MEFAQQFKKRTNIFGASGLHPARLREFQEIDKMLTDKDKIKLTMKQLVGWLVTGEYLIIQNYSNGARLSSELLDKAVREYGHKLVMPPSFVFEKIDAIQVMNEIPKKWSVRFDLWSEDEGRSDLSLECTLIENGDDLFKIEVDNLHVL